MRLHFCPSQVGASLLELLVSLALSAIILVIIVSALHGSSRYLSLSRRLAFEEEAHAKVSQLLQDIIKEYQAHRLPLTPRIHYSGRITATDGKENIISKRSDSLAPRKSADAISSIELAYLHYLRVISAHGSGGAFEYLACYFFPEILRSSQPWQMSGTKSFLALGLEGALELSGAIQSAGQPGCFTLKLSALPHSMLIPLSREQRVELIRVLVPIRRSYTLYIDQGGRLRFLSHLGVRNTENQPLLSSLVSMKIKNASGFHHSLLHLSIELEHEDGKKRVIQAVSQLPKSSFHQQLLTLG